MSQKPKMCCLLNSPLICMLLFCLPVFSQYSFTDVDALLKQNEKALETRFTMVVWKDGKIIYQKQTTDFTAKTQARIFSAGNWLTAALVMTFVDEGKISLDDKVSRYLPVFETYMKGYITIRNCLTHTTGIHADAGLGKIFDKNKHESLQEEVISYAKKEIQANPGTEFYYSNMGIDIAARIVEIISKKGFDKLIQERILRPLRMRGTSFTNEEGGAINPSGGSRSTALDYINFLSMLLNKGIFEGKQVLSEKSVIEMETSQFPQLPVKYTPKPTEGLHYGLGTWIEEVNGDGTGSVISCNNLLGDYPYIDRCRNYAAILIVAKPREEQKKEFYKRLKEAVDSQINSNCKE
jgi:CubicO group peptidase (beta-lactamase class C family)